MKKRLLSGNEAVAEGAFAAGVKFASAYPGTPSTEILEHIARLPGVYAEWSPNEKVALEVGIGASLAGTRTLVAMKHVGLNVAADPWMTLPYVGVNGGLVLACADDPGMHSSQNEQDSRYYAKMAKVPMLEPADSQEAYEMTRLAFELSEKYDTPVMLRLETRISHSRTVVRYREEREEVDYPYTKDAVKRVMIPGHARLRHPVLIHRLKELEAEAERFAFNRMEMRSREAGIISSGVNYYHVREAFPAASVLKLGFTHPLPRALIREFSEHVDRVYIVEELEPFLEEAVATLGIKVVGKERIPRDGELNPKIVAEALGDMVAPKGAAGPESLAEDRSWLDAVDLPNRPPVMCPGCPHRGIFHSLAKLKMVVSGDIGCYTLSVLPPLEGIDCQVCMGAGVGMALGMEKAFARSEVNAGLARKVVGVLGDSTFIHSGITGLVDMVYNGSYATVIILDNRTTAMTGFQEHPGTGVTVQGQCNPALDLAELCKTIGVSSVQVIDPWNLEETERVIKEEAASAATSVIISSRPCILKQPLAREGRLEIDEELCNDCGLCMRLGCPALAKQGEKPAIVQELCAGCDLCEQLCRRGAIERKVPDDA